MDKVVEKDYEAAAKLLVEYIDEEPADPLGFINLGNLLAATDQEVEAERLFLRAIELDDQVATAYYGLGNIYYNNGLYDQAEKMYQHCMKLGLDDADVFYMLGKTYVEREDTLLALPFLQRASELDKNPATMFSYGLALAQTNYLQEAKLVLEAVIDLDQDHADALYNLGIIAVHDDAFDNALSYFERVLKLQPEHTLAQEAKAKIMK